MNPQTTDLRSILFDLQFITDLGTTSEEILIISKAVKNNQNILMSAYMYACLLCSKSEAGGRDGQVK